VVSAVAYGKRAGRSITRAHRPEPAAAVRPGCARGNRRCTGGDRSFVIGASTGNGIVDTQESPPRLTSVSEDNC